MPPPKDPIKYAIWIEKQKTSHTGKHADQSTLDKMSASHKGKEPWNKGVPSSEITKKRQSDALKNKPKPPRSKEHCENIGKSKTGEKNPMFGKHIEHISIDMKCPLCGSRNVKKFGFRNMVSGERKPLAKCNTCKYSSDAIYFKCE
jgi:hypothetical protein